MPAEKAAMFVDDSNIFKGTEAFSRYLVKSGRLQQDQYLRIKWDRLVEILESQDGGLDMFARHFFAYLPPAADANRLRHRPGEEELEELIKRSSQTGFYRMIQGPPLNFTLHSVPVRIIEVKCRVRMKQAHYKCLQASDGRLECGLSLSPDECYKCNKEFIYKYEKGLDVALATELVIFCGAKSSSLNRVILVAGDGDYKEAVRYLRRNVGKDVQIASWGIALSKLLEKDANKPSILLDDHWQEICEIRRKSRLEELPGVDEEGLTDKEWFKT